MIFKTNSLTSQKLLSIPESGMGYQIISARLVGRLNSENYVVFNSELILNLDSYFSSFQRQIITRGFSNILNEAKQLPIETSSITLIAKSTVFDTRMMNESKKKEKHRYSGGKGAKDSPKLNADGKEIFVRVSAYGDDKRIDMQNKKLKDGTYTTTQHDYLDCINFKDDPIDRYALPNDEKIMWAFFIQPKIVDTLQKGIVQPAFDHDGGGIEAYFENGTSNNTYLERRSYGQ